MRQLILIGALLPAMALAYSSGPPDGMTGAPGESTCLQCHNGNPINSGNGSLTITGPDLYVPGESYEFTVTLQDPGQLRWGFEFTPLDKGQLQVTDFVNTQGHATGDNSYLKHTSAGSHAGTADGPTAWTFTWIAPATDEGPITFYAAGNAANNNNSTSGDFIYTTSFVSEANTAVTPGAGPRDFQLLAVFPNPFNPSAQVSYRLVQAGELNLDVYDLSGRLVSRLSQGLQGAGEHVARWNGMTLAGRPAPTGVYLARLEMNGQVDVRRMLLVK